MTSCPKCGTPRERAEPHGACPTCGLRLDRWAAFDDRPTPDPVLDPAFAALGWDAGSTAGHDAFLSLAQTAGLLEGAAARYRHAVKREGAALGDEGRAQAERALAQIAVLAVHEAQPKAPLSAGGPKVLGLASLFVAAVLCVLVGVVLWRTFGKGFSVR